ncbi:MAG: hypothetical protein M3Z66_10765, partial [Chloroflexota bacterium]|nr:hypothetical protein [Chloroflexota bacterium]
MVQAAPASLSGTLRTFLLADIRGYTAYSHQHGDDAAAHLSEAFLALCREVVADHQGDLFGSAGDQALAAFPSARSALRAAVALQARLAREQETHPALPMRAG